MPPRPGGGQYHTGRLKRRLAEALLAAALLATPALADERSGVPSFTARLLLSDEEPLRDRDERTAELFYAALRASWEKDGWGARAELRGREERFRAYYPGQVWLEEGYAFAATPFGEARLGKLERVFGLPDETFGGTLFSFDGITRNPDWGVGLDGKKRSGFDTLSWTLAYYGRNDHVAWELDGRGVESDPSASLRDAVSFRAAYEINQGLTALTPGLSVQTEHIVRDGGLPQIRRNDMALDVTGRLAMISLGLEAFVRRGHDPAPGEPARPTYGDAGAGMASLKAEFPSVVWRYVYSEWRYTGFGASERQHLGSATWTPRKGIEGTIEITGRRFRDSSGARAYNAVRFGLGLTF